MHNNWGRSRSMGGTIDKIKVGGVQPFEGMLLLCFSYSPTVISKIHARDKYLCFTLMGHEFLILLDIKLTLNLLDVLCKDSRIFPVICSLLKSIIGYIWLGC